MRIIRTYGTPCVHAYNVLYWGERSVSWSVIIQSCEAGGLTALVLHKARWQLALLQLY